MQEVQKALSKFGKHVVKESRTALTKRKKNASKALYNSIKYDLDVSKNSFRLAFFMEDYGQFVDKGVSGTQKKYNTPYSYRDKQPPSRVFEKWIKQKGIRGRDKEGKFITTKSLSFLISRSIFRNGMKPSLFFTKPFESAFKKLPDDLVQKFGLDVEDLLRHTLKDL
jgi:hypothetical protein